MALPARRAAVTRGVENAVLELRSKARTHLAGKRTVLEEIGNKVVTTGTRLAKKPECSKVSTKPVKGSSKITNVTVPPRPPAAVNCALKETVLKALSPVPMDVSMQEENLCQAFSDVLLNNIEDIDAEDWENPQLCSDYMKDIYL